MAYSNPFALGTDALDDPLIFDACPSFAGGMVSNVRANLLQENQAPLLYNCEISRNGEVRTRRGSTPIGARPGGANTYVQGLISYETPSDNYLVRVNATKLNYFNGSVWGNFAAGFTASSTTNQVGFVQGINKLYFADLGVGHLYSWDGTTLVDLSNVGGASNTNPPAAPIFLAWHTNRLVCVGGPTLPDTLFFSQFLDPTVWDNANWSLRVGAGEGDAITGIYAWSDYNLIVFKRHSTWIVNCNPLLLESPDFNVSAFSVQTVHRHIGCMAPNTAVQVGSDVFFLSDSGVRSIKRVVAAETQTEASDAISLPIQDFIDRINQAAIATSCAVFFDNKYILGVPLDTATSPNFMLVYDVLNQSWSGQWYGWSPTCFAIRNIANSGPRLCFGQNNGNVSEFLSYVMEGSETGVTFQDWPDDVAADIFVRIRTRAMTFGELLLRKEGFNAEFEFNGSLATAIVTVLIDGGGFQAFDSIASSGQQVTLPAVLPFVLGTSGVIRAARDLQRYGLFREIQFQMDATAQKLVLRSIAGSAFLHPLLIQST